MELPIDMNPAGGGAPAVPAVGLRLGYAVSIQSRSVFSFVYLLPACECRREEKTELGWLLLGLFTGNLSVPVSLPNW